MPTDEYGEEVQLVSGNDLPTGNVREDMIGEKLWLHMDADNADHPLAKKALVRGIPVKVRR